MKRFKLFLALLTVLTLLTSCAIGGGGTGGGADDEGKNIKVMLAVSEGVTVKSENPVYVSSGESATFEIEVDPTYSIESVEGGVLEGNTVTVENVTRDTTVRINATNLGYDTTVKYSFYFNGTEKDTTTLSNGSRASAGTSVTVIAGDNSLPFLGWSLGSYSTATSDMISTERRYTFRLAPELANSDGVISLYANYKDNTGYYYDANGGTVNLGTELVSNCDYYSVNRSANRLSVTHTALYREIYEAVHLFWDDGTFARDGYVLVEYNTKADGSGEAYSLGSMYYPDPDSTESCVLYCIWSEESDESLFTYEPVQYDMPSGVTAAKAPNWHTIGYKITSYSGDEDTVTIPEYIGDYPVTAIGEGAFVGKSMKTLVLSKNILAVEDGAFVGCSELETVYYSDSVYYIEDEAFDSDSYSSFTSLYVNATMAPRFANTDSGAYSVKLSRLLASEGESRIIVIAGSSTYQGLSSAYMEALLSATYRVINFGTTRTTHGLFYLEAMKHYASAEDIVIYAPENSTYMMGEGELYWKTARDLECMYNIYRYVDISNYSGAFSALSDFNRNYRYSRNAARYENCYDRIANGSSVNEYGEYQNAKRVSVSDAYVDSYYITLNDRYKSKFEGEWDDTANQEANKNYNDPENLSWQSITDEELVYLVNHAVDAAKESGAKVYFSYSPVDADKLVEEARSVEWIEAYATLIAETYNFDGALGSPVEYVYAHEYFYDCAFHLNDIGRTYRTYQLYLDICDELGMNSNFYDSVGKDFEGCIFEESADGKPIISVDYLK